MNHTHLNTLEKIPFYYAVFMFIYKEHKYMEFV